MKELINRDYLNQVKELGDVRKRVVVIYNMFPNTVQSDRALIEQYLRFFFSCNDDMFFDKTIDIIYKNKISFESITRAGRYLREKYAERYKRTEAIEMHTAMKQMAYITTFADGMKTLYDKRNHNQEACMQYLRRHSA